MLKVLDGNKIFLTRGDSGSVTVTLTDAGGDPYDASGDTVEFGVKKSIYDTECLIKKTLEDGETITFVPEDTKDLDFGDYLYDVQVTHVTEGESDEDDVTDIWTPIAACKFTVGFEIL